MLPAPNNTLILPERNKLLFLVFLFVISALNVPTGEAAHFLLFGIPYSYFLYLILAIAVALYGLRHFKDVNRWTWIWIGAMALMAGVGFMNMGNGDFAIKKYIGDLVICTGFIMGVLWARTMDLRGQLLAILWSTIICQAAIIVSHLLLRAGIIASSDLYNTRLFDRSNFMAAYLIMVTMVFLFQGRRQLGPVLANLVILLTISGSIIMLFFAYVSATRSIFMIFAGTMLLLLFSQFPPLRRLTLPLAILALFSIHGFITGEGFIIKLISSMGGHLGERFARTNLMGEVRYQELMDMFQQMSSIPASQWVGAGFGMGILSPLAELDADGTVLSPHIGIMSFYFKGGLFVFLGLIVPIAVRSLFSYTFSPQMSQMSMAAISGVFVYLAFASLSGGYDFLQLFLLGMMLEIYRRLRLTEQPPPKPEG